MKTTVSSSIFYMLAVTLLALLTGCAAPSVWHKPPAPVLTSYSAPAQTPIEKDTLKLPRTSSGFSPTARAQYALTAHVMTVARYENDSLAPAAPVDLTLAWGPAATRAAQSLVRVSQASRWFFWEVSSLRDAGFLSKAEVVSSMANVHMVPSRPTVRTVLDQVKPGDSIRASGYLVDLTHPFPLISWSTSLLREDSGAGSCEIFYVTDIEIISQTRSSSS